MNNDKVIEKLAVIITDECGSGPNNDFARIILAAIQADPLAYVKPKPLNFEYVGEIQGHKTWAAGACGLCYTVRERQITPHGLVFDVFLGGARVNNGWRRSDIAQAAAYDDLCERVGELFQ